MPRVSEAHAGKKNESSDARTGALLILDIDRRDGRGGLLAARKDDLADKTVFCDGNQRKVFSVADALKDQRRFVDFLIVFYLRRVFDLA